MNVVLGFFSGVLMAHTHRLLCFKYQVSFMNTEVPSEKHNLTIAVLLWRHKDISKKPPNEV
jgi:hypothetical protein